MSAEQTTESFIYSSFANDEDLGELVEMYVDEMPERINCLEDFRNSGNWEQLKIMAHQIKGSGQSYGFEIISQLAAAVECAIRDEESESDIDRKLGELLSACNRAR